MRRPSVAAGSEPAVDSGKAEGATGQPSALGAPLRYFRRLWRGELPLARVFWTDMLVIATVVNLASLGAAVILLAGDTPAIYGVAAFLAHIPYNIVVFAGVWRSAAREGSAWSGAAQSIALAWLIVSLLI